MSVKIVDKTTEHSDLSLDKILSNSNNNQVLVHEGKERVVFEVDEEEWATEVGYILSANMPFGARYMRVLPVSGIHFSIARRSHDRGVSVGAGAKSTLKHWNILADFGGPITVTDYSDRLQRRLPSDCGDMHEFLRLRRMLETCRVTLASLRRMDPTLIHEHQAQSLAYAYAPARTHALKCELCELSGLASHGRSRPP